MIRIIAAFLCLASLASPAAAADRRYSVTDFERIIIEGPYTVRLVVGAPSSAVASGTPDALDRVTVDVQSQTLRIRRNRQAWGGRPGADHGRVTIVLSTRNLRSLRLIGPATVEVEGGRGLNVELVVEGSGRLRATSLAVDNLSVGLLGSGSFELGGSARALTGDFQGSGNVEASRLIARGGTVTTNTSGTVALQVTGPVTIHANGLGAVSVAGRPVCTIDGPGADLVRCPAPASDQR